jgi:hypothetical protein
VTRSDGFGNFRMYAPVPAEFVYETTVVSRVGCETGGCEWIFTNGRSSTPGLALTFSTSPQFDVESKYEAKWDGLLAQGMTISGLAVPELQLRGAAVTLWTMTAAGKRSDLHLPITGVQTHTTRYSRADYLSWTRVAAEYDYTLDELQKGGALFWSWLLAGKPPIVETP